MLRKIKMENLHGNTLDCSINPRVVACFFLERYWSRWIFLPTIYFCGNMKITNSFHYIFNIYFSMKIQIFYFSEISRFSLQLWNIWKAWKWTSTSCYVVVFTKNFYILSIYTRKKARMSCYFTIVKKYHLRSATWNLTVKFIRLRRGSLIWEAKRPARDYCRVNCYCKLQVYRSTEYFNLFYVYISIHTEDALGVHPLHALGVRRCWTADCWSAEIILRASPFICMPLWSQRQNNSICLTVKFKLTVIFYVDFRR